MKQGSTGKYLHGCPVGSCSHSTQFQSRKTISENRNTFAWLKSKWLQHTVLSRHASIEHSVQCFIWHGSHLTSVSGIDTGVWGGQVTGAHNKSMFMEAANEPLLNQEGENRCIFLINKTGKAIKWLLWDLFIISCCNTMQPHWVKTCTPRSPQRSACHG